MEDILFSTERLRFRKWTEADRVAFRQINANPEVMEYFTNVLTAEESDALVDRLDTHFDEKGFGLYTVDRTDLEVPSFIGFIGLSTPRFEHDYGPDWVEIGWRTHPSSWGVGLATEGAKAVLEHGFHTIGLNVIYSMTSLTNKRSERIMQKIGMEHIGFFDHPLVDVDSDLRAHTLYSVHK